MRGPRSSWQRRARSAIWRGIWASFPDGIEVFKTKAHRCEAQLGEDAFERLCWAGNRRADDRAKAGALQHPGGELQLQRGLELAQRLADLYRFMAKQGAAVASGEARDHDELKNHTAGSVKVRRCKGSRRRWKAPAWLQELAALAPRGVVPGGDVLHVGVQVRSPPLRRFAERGHGHEWQLHAVRDLEGIAKGKLLSCQLCGCYIHARAQKAAQDCPGYAISATCKLQLKR
eukprot:690832-Amphidinium_carterae.1